MRTTRVGVMGFGQVSRRVFLSSLDDPHAEVVAVSDVGERNILHHLLARFTTPRDLARPLRAEKPSEVRWDVLGAEVVADATGRSWQCTDEPVVSSDVIGNPHSSIFDTSFTRLTDGRFLKTLAWYDNEWGYSNRVCDLLQLLGTLR